MRADPRIQKLLALQPLGTVLSAENAAKVMLETLGGFDWTLTVMAAVRSGDIPSESHLGAHAIRIEGDNRPVIDADTQPNAVGISLKSVLWLWSREYLRSEAGNLSDSPVVDSGGHEEPGYEEPESDLIGAFLMNLRKEFQFAQAVRGFEEISDPDDQVLHMVVPSSDSRSQATSESDPSSLDHAPNSLAPRLRQASQEDHIINLLHKLGLDPMNLPRSAAGKAGVKKQVRDECGNKGMWVGRTVFDKAWERLLKDNRITYVRTGIPQTGGQGTLAGEESSR